MLTKKETLDTIKKTLNLYKTNVLDNIYAKTEYVDSKALPIILINDENKTGPALFPLLPEHNLVFIAGDAQIPDSTGAITTIYGLCYSDLQGDGSKLITEYRTGKVAKVNSNGVLESFEYIDMNVKSIVSNIKGGTINKVLAKNSDTDFDYKWVDMPSIETFKKYVDDVKASIVVPTKTSELTNDSNFLTEHQSLTGLATETYVNDKVAGIVNSAPETLDTLQELATALGNDANFATTVSTQIGKKVDKADGMSLTHNDLTNELKANYDAAYTYSQAKHSYNDLTDKPTIPSIDGLATEEYVQNAIASAGTGGSDVATDEEVKTTINTILGGDYIE